MADKTSSFGLTGNMLKLFALIVMTIDHVGAYLLPEVTELRIIGRLALPIYAWMIAEGCFYTKSRLRYLLVIAGVAVVMQVVEYIFNQSLQQCILVTFTLSILLIYCVDLASKKQNFLTILLMGVVFCGVVYVCELLPGDIPTTDFSIDYGLMGVLLPVMIFIGRNKSEKLILCAAGLIALAMTNWLQWYALPSLLLLAFYSGKKGKMQLKYLFYIYYPLHLVVIYAVGLLLN